MVRGNADLLNNDDALIEPLRNKYIVMGGKLAQSAWKICGIYVSWICIHFVAARLYARYCTPYSIIGFITAPFIVASPHCVGLRWCIVRGSDTIMTMWIVMGTWIASHLGGFHIS